jgi:DNA-binding transcriptional LysR family regulator
MRYTLRQLEVFLAVAKAESVSRAAALLFMSQSAASGSLADLERQFDVRLFDRVGKRLQLSDFGRLVRVRAEAVLDQARELERAFQDRSVMGSLRIGATLTIGNYVAVALMARFIREHKGAEVSLALANMEEIARKVRNFEIDVGLVEGEIEPSDLEVSPWRDDELVVFCAPDHPFAKKRALNDEDLRQAAWIVREQGSGTRQTFDRAMRGLLSELNITLVLQQTEAIRGAVEAGLGVGCLSRLTVEDAVARGTLKLCKVPHRNFRRRFFFVLHKQKHRSAAISAWVELCRREAA